MTQTSCPLAAQARSGSRLDPHDELQIPLHRRAFVTYGTSESGARELQIDYTGTQISFDEPELFAFGETLARQSRFTAIGATHWGAGYPWPRVRALLEELLDAGLIERTSPDHPPEPPRNAGIVASPLPPSECKRPRTWHECAAITHELTGRAVEVGLLELVMPVHRVAHMALDADGRQVGEANVYPPSARLDIPTEWRSCQYTGSRYAPERPMNVTALKTMVRWWKPMMVAFSRVRAAYMERYPGTRAEWAARDLHRLATLVMSVPAYLLMRARDPLPPGQLHPVLSSLYRVTDGVRSTINQMLLFPVDGRVPEPGTPLSASEVYAYAERHHVLVSPHGVCAGPRALIEEFLDVFICGKRVAGAEDVVLGPQVEGALAALGPAFDYGLCGTQAYAIVNGGLLDAGGRMHERLLDALRGFSPEPNTPLHALQERLEKEHERWDRGLMFRDEERAIRNRVNADTVEHCERGLRGSLAASDPAVSWSAAQERAGDRRALAQLRSELAAALAPVLAARSGEEAKHADALLDALLEHVRALQGLVRRAEPVQSRINRILGRPPACAFSADDLRVQLRILHAGIENIEMTWPLAEDALEAHLGLRFEVTGERIGVSVRARPEHSPALRAPAQGHEARPCVPGPATTRSKEKEER
jgi:hypothetical protein